MELQRAGSQLSLHFESEFAMPKEFRLELTNPPQGVYFPGMAITGTVVCATDEPKSYKQILVTLRGGAHVHWTETETTGTDEERRTRTRTYSSSEEYVSCSAVLWDKRVNGQGGSFPVGSYRFNFSLQLIGPSCGTNMPASYTGSVGSISYSLEARIAKGMLKFDEKAVATLNVGNVVNINGPQLLSPLAMEVRKTLCCLCCASGPIVITARIPRTGFCIGHDSIPVEIAVENGSNRQIPFFQIALTKKVIYTAQGRHRYDDNTLTTVITRAVAPNETTVLQPDPIAIPVDTFTTQNSSWILTINYFLVITASLSYSVSPRIDLPIIIGNVPLGGSSQSGSGFRPEPASANYYPPPPPLPSAPVDTQGQHPPCAPSNQMPIGFVDPIKKM